MRVRVRIALPDARQAGALGVSLALHALLVTLLLVATVKVGATPPPGPVISVRLAAGPSAPEPAPRTTSPKPAPKPAAPKPEPPKPAPETKAPPRKEPELRRRVDEPEVVSRDDEGAVARPERLPVAEEPEPAPAGGEGVEGEEGAPEGEGEGALPEGPIGGGVAGVDTDQPLNADWYIRAVVQRLQASWRNRPMLPPGSAPQRVVVAFTIARDGSLRDVRVDRRSGYAPLDISARSAVSSIEKFPPLPPGYDADELGARFVFELVPPDR